LQEASEVYKIREAIVKFHGDVNEVFTKSVPSYVMDVVVYEVLKIDMSMFWFIFFVGF
jgi:hypothetical protein